VAGLCGPGEVAVGQPLGHRVDAMRRRGLPGVRERATLADRHQIRRFRATLESAPARVTTTGVATMRTPAAGGVRLT